MKASLQSTPRILIMAGGTGGHVFPGLAVADALKQRGWQVDWLGTAERMEADLVPRHGYPIHFIKIKGIRGHGVLRKLLAPIQLIKAIWQAKQVIQRIRPDVVIGMGGFASGPGAIAAKLLRVPVILHEQNAIAGMTNRYVAKFATHVLQAFEGALPNGITIGNPVRAELFTLEQRQSLACRPLNLLIMGGSLGAKALNEVLPETISLLAERIAVQVWHQAGKDKGADVLAAYHELGITPYQADDFIHEISQAYQWADLVICRAGALTVSELAAVGRASILVPLPHAVDDHQTANAKVLVKANAAVLLPQAELMPPRLAQEIQQITQQPERINKMAQNAEQVARSDAAEQVARVCEALIQSRGVES